MTAASADARRDSPRRSRTTRHWRRPPRCWRHRCPRCQAEVDRRKAQARPDLHNDAAERRRRAAVVAEHRLRYGDWCPGYSERPGRPGHPSADLTADHAGMVALGADPGGPLVVRCRSCNAARAAALLAIAARQLGGSPHGRPANDPAPAERPITHRDGDDPGPVVA